MTMTTTREAFVDAAARYDVVPVITEVLADRETPVTVFEKLVGDRDGFLLESVEGGEQWARWSFIGWDPEFTLVATNGVTTAEGAAVDLPDGDPLSVLEEVLATITAAPLEGDAPPLHAGAVGYLAYDAVRYVERLPGGPTDDRGLPEMVWQFVGRLAVFDRYRQTVLLIRNVFQPTDPDSAFDAALADLDDDAARLGVETAHAVVARPDFGVAPAYRANMTQAGYEAAVRRSIEYVEAGDVFQVVPSLRLEVDFTGDPFAAYRALRLVNPSPFLFFIRHGDVAIVGSSPELMTRARDGIATSRPIAGTRPRGATPAEDDAFEAELLADPKERAEHVMLVDLARNDLGRVCEFGSVVVDELMVIERYSHVMHIVSGVTGKLRPDVGPVDVLRATFPHGTV
ncbi:MAG: chorismate-binding protein, partial [Acidimicrobiia bacterium]|nr:chorismate-binding protein [Acidimicrobiia bacterium]